MKLLKLTVFFSLSALIFIACKKTDYTTFSNNNIPLTAAQVKDTFVINTTAAATASAEYSRVTKTLTYTITWTGVDSIMTTVVTRSGSTVRTGLDTLTALRVSGPSDSTGNGPGIQLITGSSSGLSALPKTKTLNGSLYIDGIVLTEENLLNGRYYFTLNSAARPHTAAKTAHGLLRGQITLKED